MNPCLIFLPGIQGDKSVVLFTQRGQKSKGEFLLFFPYHVREKNLGKIPPRSLTAGRIPKRAKIKSPKVEEGAADSAKKMLQSGFLSG